MTMTESKTEVVTVRVSTRILSRVRRILSQDGQHLSEFVRLAMLRQVEQRERRGN